MFDKILIANRGEIACRITSTAHQLGISTVAIYSDVDANALHVKMADHAVCVGGATPGESYLNGTGIIAAAIETGAQAIHPGYGFLSENPDFAAQVAAAGLVFVGPSPQAIRAMGQKGEAKNLMARAGVPVVPGYHGENQDAACLCQQARKIGFPLMIKAVAGGGGKGMRRVDDVDAFPAALSAARSEAANAFGNDVVLLEKFIPHPRHIEVQIFGDGKRVVHLFERDCSLQRRHQKVIEEAPAPGMTRSVRNAMTQAAVKAARAIDYCGAGTVEFIVDGTNGLKTDGFWFMEMNTRLQVEHPVTETITGVDLVAWQLRVAAGLAIPLGQEQIKMTGHAVEARIYAEDPARGFLPRTGRVHHLEFPDECRVDSGIDAGDVITPYYDPMLAKIIVSADDRAAAFEKIGAALDRTQIAGVTTNVNFLSRLAAHPAVVSGQVDTDLIGRNLDQLNAVCPPPDAAVILAAIAAAGLQDGFADPFSGFSLWAPLTHAISLVSGDLQYDVALTVHNPDRVSIKWHNYQGELVRVNSAWCVEGQAQTGRAVISDQQIDVFDNGHWGFGVRDSLGHSSDDRPDCQSDDIHAPMPGTVRAVDVTKGQTVEMDDQLMILEAMKMEHRLRAPRAGIVAEIYVQTGTQVDAGTLLVRFEAA